MEREIYTRLLRRVCTAVLALLLLFFAAVPVLADEAGSAAEPDGAADTAPETEPYALTEENFAAVAAQLEAVAREEGRTIADKMLYESLRAISPVTAPAAESESSAEPAAAAAQGKPAVVVHTAQQSSWSFSGLLPFLVVVAAAMVCMFTVVVSARRSWTGRRPAFARGYRPMHDRTFREKTLEKRSALRLTDE